MLMLMLTLLLGPFRWHPWIFPKPWPVGEAAIDLRAGGRYLGRMEGPADQAHPSDGSLLAEDTYRYLAFTGKFLADRVPIPDKFSGHVFLEDASNGHTLYTAWTAEVAVSSTRR